MIDDYKPTTSLSDDEGKVALFRSPPHAGG